MENTAPSKRGFALAVAAAFVGLGLWLAPTLASSSHTEPTVAKTPALARPVPVRTQTAVRAQGYASKRQFSGTLQAKRQADLSFLRAGYLVEVLVDEGQEVAAGAILARLDQRELRARRARLEAQLAAAEARGRELQAGPRLEPRSGAQAEVRRLEAELELARLKQSRRQRLFEAGAVPLESLDELTATVASLQQRLEAARQASLELENGTRPEVLAQAQADIDAARAELQALEVDWEDCQLRAPFAGRVLARLLDEGTVVSPGRAVVTLAETGALEARISLPQTLQPPSPARLVLTDRVVQGRLLGRVPQVDQRSNTVVVRYAVDQGWPGEPVLLETEERVQEAGFWLPISALSSAGDGVWQCYTVTSSGLTEPQRLELLHRETDRALVRGTLREGDRVVVDGLGQIVPGQPVDPMDSTTP